MIDFWSRFRPVALITESSAYNEGQGEGTNFQSGMLAEMKRLEAPGIPTSDLLMSSYSSLIQPILINFTKRKNCCILLSALQIFQKTR
ncbi:unnamed protein product, partial [Mesorhabditis spiculigera]